MLNIITKFISLVSLLTNFVYSQTPCQIVVPAFPLTYNGLITPYQLLPPCDMKIAPSFAEAVILDLDTNSLSVYHPLIVNAGTTPLVPPITFNMPKNSLVGIWFGSNAAAISLTPLTSIQQGQCIFNVGGITSQDTFGQFAHCNAIAFFQKIKEIILNNIPLNPPIPELGIASDGDPCLTTRDFALVDMDPSDNVVTTYLIDMATGKTAQNTFNNQNTNPQAVILKNGSDNLLLASLDIIMGCKPYQVPNIVDQNNPVNSKISSMALDEIHAAVRQQKIYAYLPKGDPMVRINNMPSLAKLNAYRQGIFQPIVEDLKMADTNLFCAHYTNIQLPRLLKNKQNFIVQPSPDQAISTNLYGFLLNRFSTSYMGINCNFLLDIQNPITLILNNNNLVIDGTISLIPKIETPSNDPYILSWDEYPDFINPTTLPPPTTQSPTTLPPPTTHVPTTLPPTTPPPTTHVPTTLPPTNVPTTPPPTTMTPEEPYPTDFTPSPQISNINNVNTDPGRNILIISCSVVGSIVVLYICCYCSRRNNNNNTNTQPYVNLESIKSDNDKNDKNDKSDSIKLNIMKRGLSPSRTRINN